MTESLPPPRHEAVKYPKDINAKFVAKLLIIGIMSTPWVPGSAQGIGGARSGRVSGGTPAKPGFLRSKKCAQMKF
jgi:hypothetical protein